ncbi:MAG: hypothetical protein HUU55_16235 [Myxococcales bacterium]|nr:hypothetical protein [Myxococcales bacterium]
MMTTQVLRARLVSLVPASATTSLACLQWCSVDDHCPIRPGDVAQCLVSGHEGVFVAFASVLNNDGRFEWLVRHKTLLYSYLESIGDGVIDMRAPFGRPFPMDRMVGRSVVLVASGTGIAPMRAVVQTIMIHRHRYQSVTLLYGARNAQDFAFSSEIEVWRENRILTLRTVSQLPAKDWSEGVGYVQRHLGQVLGLGRETYVLVCGGYSMTQETMDLAEALGVSPDHIFSNY